MRRMVRKPTEGLRNRGKVGLCEGSPRVVDNDAAPSQRSAHTIGWSRYDDFTGLSGNGKPCTGKTATGLGLAAYQILNIYVLAAMSSAGVR